MTINSQCFYNTDKSLDSKGQEWKKFVFFRKWSSYYLDGWSCI